MQVMNCLATEQLVELALADATAPHYAAQRAHADVCADCAARLARIRADLGRLEAAMTWFDRDHAAQRQRLLTTLANIQPGLVRPGVIRTLREIVAMPRTWIGSAAAAVLALGIFFLVNGTGAAPLLAQTLQALREIQSYQCRFTSTSSSPDGKNTETMTGKMYWEAPGSIRLDTYKGEKLIEQSVMPNDKPGLDIDHRAEAYRRLEPLKGSRSMSPLLLMGRLAGFSGQADRVLEPRQLNGVAAPGFEIAITKIDPDVGDGTLRLWTDPKSKLPLRVEVTKEAAYTMVWDDFRWNLPSDQWFTVEPPAAYQDKTPAPQDVEKITKDIVNGLKTFARYCGGKYPQVKMVYGDVTSEELNKSAGLPPRSPPTDKALQEVYAECLRASVGFGQINVLQRHSADAVYHGKTVGPQDKDKVLFRWKLNDGRFRVIFGDLRVQDVDEAALGKLERK
jgi:outer membrane lipoprotein-sorting protein